MRLLYNNKDISPQELISCNRCRLHLRATTLANITTADGRRIRRSSLNVEDDRVIPDNYVWPQQPRPCDGDRNIWKRCLLLTLHTSEANPNIHYDLGPWNEWVANLEWKWMYSTQEEVIYEKEDEGWKAWATRNTRTRGTSGNFTRTGWYIRPSL